MRERDGFRTEDALDINGLEDVSRQHNIRGTRSGKDVRDYFASYFMSEAGSVMWQMNKI